MYGVPTLLPRCLAILGVFLPIGTKLRCISSIATTKEIRGANCTTNNQSLLHTPRQYYAMYRSTQLTVDRPTATMASASVVLWYHYLLRKGHWFGIPPLLSCSAMCWCFNSDTMYCTPYIHPSPMFHTTYRNATCQTLPDASWSMETPPSDTNCFILAQPFLFSCNTLTTFLSSTGHPLSSFFPTYHSPLSLIPSSKSSHYTH